jgi:hypothetical protein
MKKLLLLSAAVAIISTSAFAQSTVVTTTGAGHSAVQIEPEYRTRIKTYVTEHKFAPWRPRKRSSSEAPYRATSNSRPCLPTGAPR